MITSALESLVKIKVYWLQVPAQTTRHQWQTPRTHTHISKNPRPSKKICFCMVRNLMSCAIVTAIQLNEQ